jgi:hypothetical protein
MYVVKSFGATSMARSMRRIASAGSRRRAFNGAYSRKTSGLFGVSSTALANAASADDHWNAISATKPRASHA